MRIQQTQNTQRIYDDIRLARVVTTSNEQELLTSDLFNAESEEVHLFEVIASDFCHVVFTFITGKESHPKPLYPDRVITFENLRPIKSIKFVGNEEITLEFAIAL